MNEAPWAGEERRRRVEDEGGEMSAGSAEATRWNAVEVGMEIRRGINANRWEQRKGENKKEK